ncbi:MAG: GTPase, partial [Planctomycetota bacterium]
MGAETARLPVLPATAGDVLSLVERIDRFLATADAWRTIVTEREALRSRAAAIGSQQEAATGPLRVLLLGGTGAGKSTLLNALAGAEVARASASRPTTMGVTAYHHAATSVDSLGAAVLREAAQAPHTHEPLRDKIIIDAPDFDSNLIANREVLGRALQVADLVITVATTEKYLTRELFRWLAAHRDRFRRTSFVFVLNKADLGVAPEVLEDFRAELAKADFPDATILSLSARRALEARLTLSEGSDLPVPSAGDFDQLRRLLEEELDRVRIHAIKAGNLSASLTTFTARIGELLPDDAEAQVAAWEAECGSALRDFADDVAARMLSRLEGDREARNLAALTLGTSFRGFYGLASGLAYAVRCAIRPDFRRLRGAGATAARDLLRGSALAAAQAPAGEEIALVLRGQVHAARRHGLYEGAVEEAGADARRPEVAAGLIAGVEEWLAARLDETFGAAAGGRAQTMLGTAANVPPLIFTAWAVWRLADGYLYGPILGLNFIGASAALLAVLLWIEFWLVDRWYVGPAADRCFAVAAGLLKREAER